MKTLLTALVALALAACASQGTTTASDSPRKMEEKEYRTGSRIPVRDGVSSSPTDVASPSAMNPALPPKM
ncbi:MAG: hypothetical protein U1F48_01390 [Burkholderiales bacterium]